MKNKKLIIILSLLLIYGIIMVIIFSSNKKSDNNENKENNGSSESINNGNSQSEKINAKYLILDNDSNWVFDCTWSKTTISSIKNATNHFKIYADNNYVGEYKLVHSNNWNIFDDEDNFIPYNGKLFAFSNDFDIRLIRINSATITDSDKEFITSGYENKSFDYLISNDVVNIDLDDNGVIDKIVVLSNSFNEENVNNYNLVYIVLNGRLFTLVNETVSDIFTSSIYNINRIFTLDDSKYIIIKETKNYIGDNVVIINHMFKYDNDNFIEIMHD